MYQENVKTMSSSLASSKNSRDSVETPKTGEAPKNTSAANNLQPGNVGGANGGGGALGRLIMGNELILTPKEQREISMETDPIVKAKKQQLFTQRSLSRYHDLRKKNSDKIAKELVKSITAARVQSRLRNVERTLNAVKKPNEKQ